MKIQGVIARLALAAAIALSPLPPAAFAESYMPPVGGFATDGTIYAGESPDTKKPMYTTPADAPDLISWSDAKDYCGALQSFGHNDWRVPGKKELHLLYENRKKEALNETFKEIGDSAGWYWSSSESDGGQAWVQNFGKGTQNQDYQDNRSSLRCVR
jgi:hypothetical protein